MVAAHLYGSMAYVVAAYTVTAFAATAGRTHVRAHTAPNVACVRECTDRRRPWAWHRTSAAACPALHTNRQNIAAATKTAARKKRRRKSGGKKRRRQKKKAAAANDDGRSAAAVDSHATTSVATADLADDARRPRDNHG